jgi:hypothetical protein
MIKLGTVTNGNEYELAGPIDISFKQNISFNRIFKIL